MKSVCVRSFSGRYFLEFGLNTERYGLSLRIQCECGKIRTRKTPNADTFHAENNSDNILGCLLLLLKIACRQLCSFPYYRQGKSRQSWDTTYSRFLNRHNSLSTGRFILSTGARYSAFLFLCVYLKMHRKEYLTFRSKSRILCEFYLKLCFSY